MTAVRTLYVAISSHGYGHLGQTAPVVNEIYRRHPQWKVVVESDLSLAVLQPRFDMTIVHVRCSTDFGMEMKDAFTVDVERSHARYVQEHGLLDDSVRGCEERLKAHAASIVLSNVAYVPIMAAQRAGIPSFNLCCLNWADIYIALCNGMPGAKAIHEQMLGAYQRAVRFIVPAPNMPMPELKNRVHVGLIAQRGQNRRSALIETLGKTARDRLVTVSMGGIDTDLDLRRWPRIDDVTWIVGRGQSQDREDMVSVAKIGWPYLDLLCSSDALICKPGYGTFAEAACNGVPIVYVSRDDWPESRFLVNWLDEHGRCVGVGRGELHGDSLNAALKAVWQGGQPARACPNGIREAADIIETHSHTTHGTRRIQHAGKAGKRP